MSEETPQVPVRGDIATRFSSTRQPASYGGKREYKHRLTQEFWRVLSKDFALHGAATLRRVREEEPAAYMRICAAIVPQEVDVHVTDDNAEHLRERLALIDAVLEARRAAAVDVEIIQTEEPKADADD